MADKYSKEWVRKKLEELDLILETGCDPDEHRSTLDVADELFEIVYELQEQLKLYEEQVIILPHDAKPMIGDVAERPSRPRAYFVVDKDVPGMPDHVYFGNGDVPLKTAISDKYKIIQRDNKPVIQLPPETKLEGK